MKGLFILWLYVYSQIFISEGIGIISENLYLLSKKMLLAVFNFVLYQSIIELLQWLRCGLNAKELELESMQSDETVLFVKTTR
jgi:hypothetical protein